MANAKERLKIFENVIARVGLDGDVLGEYAKAMSSLNGLQTYSELNPPQAPVQAIQPTMGTEPIPSATPQESALNTPTNASNGMV
jgi:hypothetical protein